ncbi:MAG: choice-of-anchor E domain-containing protein [Pseudomonadota bacterium]
MLRPIALAVGLALIAAPAISATVSFTNALAQPQDGPVTLGLQQFDPSQGTLQSVALAFSGQALSTSSNISILTTAQRLTVNPDGSIGIETIVSLPDGTQTTCSGAACAAIRITSPVQTSATIDVSGPGPITFSQTQNSAGNCVLTVAAPNCQVDLEARADLSESLNLTANLSPFIGTGNVDYVFRALSGSTLQSASVSVTYTFDDASSISPVPLPAGLPFLLAGLGGFAVLRRMRRTIR